eukprot:TRINITY_DN67388_c1_g1_i1.p1 TRINITY_DN67388_c1_g1~~TRINITY_DN67388_c1_g1_i1.p1  ORF type:complete len:386 (-),score=48.82 TRINITY_DN67388_c1_g1_i1:912-2069(-)
MPTTQQAPPAEEQNTVSIPSSSTSSSCQTPSSSSSSSCCVPDKATPEGTTSSANIKPEKEEEEEEGRTDGQGETVLSSGEHPLPPNTIAKPELGTADEDLMTPSSLLGMAHRVLATASIAEKARLTTHYAQVWKQGCIPVGCPSDDIAPLPHPARPTQLNIVDPTKVEKRNCNGNLHHKQALVHSLAHIESWAVDLAWDIICRTPHFFADWKDLPNEFWEDWLIVAEDEARHFGLLDARLREMDSHYGAFTVHEGLWDSAEETNDKLLHRLAIVHMVHEARGLDVTPKTIHKMKSIGDKTSAALLQTIYEEEISHVTKGTKWFEWLCTRENLEKHAKFHEVVNNYFRGALKPPFNVEARTKAGMGQEYYLPLTEKKRPKEERTST